MLIGLTLAPTWAVGEPLADRIAEFLCYPDSADGFSLEPEEIEALSAGGDATGSYRDIQGAEGRAWFRIRDGRMVCRVPATTDLTLFLCADVAVNETGLRRSRRYVCVD